jgi:protein-disulfide isomerase
MEMEKAEKRSSKESQNVVSIIIILIGLFAGSLFVDVLQLVRGSGFSTSALKRVNTIESAGKTWVAYTDPIVRVTVVTDPTCAECAPDQALVWLRRVMPTLVANQLDFNTPEGKKAIEQSEVISLPAFIFDKSVTETDMYAQAKTLFDEKERSYVLNTAQVGLPAGKLLATPEIKEGDIQVGSKDASVKIVEYSDFQCPYCQLLDPVIKRVLREYGDKVWFSYKQFPLSFHAQANNAALASECANEQGKFLSYSDMLFARQGEQNEWAQAEDTAKLKEYAVNLGIKKEQFSECLDSAKYQDKIDADTIEGQNFGVSGTPGTFVNDQFLGGAVSYEQLKQIIDTELAK